MPLTSPTTDSVLSPPSRNASLQPPQPQPTRDESLKAQFGAILDNLNVTGKTRQTVIDMFLRAPTEQKMAILQKYSLILDSNSPPPPVPPLRSPQDAGTPHSLQNGSSMNRDRPLPTPPTGVPGRIMTTAKPADWSNFEGYEWVDRLHGADLDKQLEKVLNYMHISGYAKSSVMNSTQPPGKRQMIKQWYSKNRMPPPNDLPQMRATSPPPPSPMSGRQSSLESFRVDDSTQPKTVEYFVSQLMNQSISTKGLFRLLSNLRVQLTLAASETFLRQFATQKVFIPSINTTFTGLQALQKIMSRLHKKQQQSETKFRTITRYGDNNVRPDEIRLQIIEVLSKFKPVDLIGTCIADSSMVSEVIHLLTSMDEISTVNLNMRINAADQSGHVCLEGDEGLAQVAKCLDTSLMGSLTCCLVDPFQNEPAGVSEVPKVDPVFVNHPTDLDTSAVWQFRTALLEFIVAFVNSDDDVKARVRVRSGFEKVGLMFALDGLSGLASGSSAEEAEFKECVLLYHTDKKDDAEELEEFEVTK
ncbi:hypothetical protein HDU98_003408 [Podochytrium sp. JEL0797]|nr:hypothetical protein HDU98_003408 [Podochytrium sp. JEL0797]